MIHTVRLFFRITMLLLVASIVVAVIWPPLDPENIIEDMPPAMYVFLLSFLTSCWCNILLIREKYVEKSSLVIWILMFVFGLPPLGFLGMLFLLWLSIRNIIATGKV